MRRGVALVLLAAAVASSACSTKGLAFTRASGVDIVQPAADGTVALPFTLRWEADRFDGTYVILFDRPPMRPGAPLISLVAADDGCRRLAQCPDAAWLRGNSVFVTQGTSVRVDHLNDLRSYGGDRDRHHVTIVLLDQAGRRIGETASSRDFSVRRAK